MDSFVFSFFNFKVHINNNNKVRNKLMETHILSFCIIGYPLFPIYILKTMIIIIINVKENLQPVIRFNKNTISSF